MSLYSMYLMNRIEELRKEMTEVALRKGMTSEESLSISQELDDLLNEYEEFKSTEDK